MVAKRRIGGYTIYDTVNGWVIYNSELAQVGCQPTLEKAEALVKWAIKWKPILDAERERLMKEDC